MIIKCQSRSNASPLKTSRLRDLYNNSPQSGGQSGCFLFSLRYLKVEGRLFSYIPIIFSSMNFHGWLKLNYKIDYQRMFKQPNGRATQFPATLYSCLFQQTKFICFVLQPGLAKWSQTSNFTNILCVFSLQKSLKSFCKNMQHY